MRKAVGWLVTWILYWIGDAVSRPMNWFDWAWLFPAYNRLMLWSYGVKVWAGNVTPWICNTPEQK